MLPSIITNKNYRRITKEFNIYGWCNEYSVRLWAMDFTVEGLEF
jgi:hypothetical protein